MSFRKLWAVIDKCDSSDKDKDQTSSFVMSMRVFGDRRSSGFTWKMEFDEFSVFLNNLKFFITIF